jgi:protein-tyrosine phosphatase
VSVADLRLSQSKADLSLSGRVLLAGRWLVKLLRRTRDSVLHGPRHRRVVRRLRTMKTPREILVVCQGNICRSPYLHAVLQRALPETSVSSAGFIGPNRPVPNESLEASRRRGLDLRDFRSRHLSSTMVRSADLIVVMDPVQARQIIWLYGIPPRRFVIAGDLDTQRTGSRVILDPWKKSLAVFESTFDRLDRCAATLVSALRHEG